ncbi:nuclear transport factor 2 family protein [Novosphingobium sp. G106]|uniref:nuclear transport factor 2 family protein n=1 Tax=Novosphingobium sp. G106 TaxID=2849500 RepID=UPI002810E622|nr:nuclear transport factor 2 family protein [Novosphingobium sp. G106]
MTSRIRELLERNLQEVFGEGDDARRQAAIAELWTEDGILYAPSGVIAGRAAIGRFAGDLRSAHPDFVYTPHGKPQILHDAGRLAWGSGPPGQAPAYTGWDVIIVRDGRIAALYVFLDESSEEFRRAQNIP